MCFLKELNYSTSTPPENSIMLRVPSKTVYTSPGNIISMLFTLQKMVLLFCKPLQEFLLFLTIVQFLSSFSVSPRLRMMQSKGPKEEWKVKGVEAQMCTLQHRYDLKTLGINELQEKKGRRKKKKKKKKPVSTQLILWLHKSYMSQIHFYQRTEFLIYSATQWVHILNLSETYNRGHVACPVTSWDDPYMQKALTFCWHPYKKISAIIC